MSVPLLRLLVVALVGLSSTTTFALEVYIERASEWSFLQGLRAPSSPDVDAWREVNFDDSSWSRGVAPFGYRQGDAFGTDLALLSPPMQNNYSTLFLRKELQLGDPAAVALLEVSVDFDDGFYVWINGHQVLGVNVLTEDFEDVAAGKHEAGDYETFSLANAKSLLVPGANVIAVQVFNATLHSTDLGSVKK